MTTSIYEGRHGWTYSQHYYGGSVERFIDSGQPRASYRCICGLNKCGNVVTARNLAGVKKAHKMHVADAHPDTIAHAITCAREAEQ